LQLGEPDRDAILFSLFQFARRDWDMMDATMFLRQK